MTALHPVPLVVPSALYRPRNPSAQPGSSGPAAPPAGLVKVGLPQAMEASHPTYTVTTSAPGAAVKAVTPTLLPAYACPVHKSWPQAAATPTLKVRFTSNVPPGFTPVIPVKITV